MYGGQQTEESPATGNAAWVTDIQPCLKNQKNRERQVAVGHQGAPSSLAASPGLTDLPSLFLQGLGVTRKMPEDPKQVLFFFFFLLFFFFLAA